MVRKKEPELAADGTEINYYNSQMTLRPTQKIRRKNKKTNLQELYNAGKVRTEEFYNMEANARPYKTWLLY